MKIENDTNYSKRELRQFIAMARPPGTKIKLVIVRNASKHHSGSGRAWGSRGRIKLKLPRKSSKHVRAVWEPRKAYLGWVNGSRDELLLLLLAHELRHLWQGQGPRPKNFTEKPKPRRGMVYGAKGRYSERDADAWAIHRLRMYRRGELNHLKRNDP